MAGQDLRFASLFSGCGGFDMGFETSGFRALGAYDNDPEALENFRWNLGGPSCISDLRVGIPNESSLKGLDALIAGPPCQGFSTAGLRQVNDERNHLVTVTADLARRIAPTVLVVENVSGVLSGDHAQYWNAMNGTMRLAGYKTHTVRCQVTHLGMAQLRRRVLFFAWRTGKDVRFETPNSAAGSLRDVLAGASLQANHHPKSLKPGTREWQIARRIKQGQKLSNVRGGDKAVPTWDIPEVFGSITDHERTVLELLRRLRRQDRQRNCGDADPVSLARLEAALGLEFHRLVESLIVKGYLRRVDDGVDLVGTFNGKYRRLSWEAPSCTVDTRFGSPRYFLHPVKERGFTVREAARIQGFRDSYIFRGSEQAQYRVIGNAVPPPLGAFAARMTRRLLGRV